jgi:hypothetical protein
MSRTNRLIAVPTLSAKVPSTSTNGATRVSNRDEALRRINEAIRQSVTRLNKRGFQTYAPASRDAGETKLLVRQGAIEVKIEANFVMRGTVQPVRMASLTPNARDMLQADLEIPVLSLEDVYGGKLVAAMDRQHPRDLFDARAYPTSCMPASLRTMEVRPWSRAGCSLKGSRATK